MHSYMIPAETRKATPVLPLPSASGMLAADSDRVSESRCGPGEPGVPSGRGTEADNPGSPGSKNAPTEHSSQGCSRGGTQQDRGSPGRRALPVLHVISGGVEKLRAASALRGDDRR